MQYNTPQVDEKDIYFMRIALQEAREAQKQNEVPVGAVIIDQNGIILSRAGNRSIVNCDPSGHAEMIAIREAGKNSDNYRLPNTTLYATIEPCVMCTGAMIHARISRLVFGARDPKAGAVVSQYLIGTDRKLNHLLEVEGGLLEDECAELLISFFKKKRH